MADDAAEQEPQTEPVDPVLQIQSALSDLDPTSMCVGFVTVGEFLEEDGRRTMCVIHTGMAPWHLHGLLTFARESHSSSSVAFEGDFDFELDDEDE